LHVQHSTLFLIFSLLPPPPNSTLFPYTTLFRSSRMNWYHFWTRRAAILQQRLAKRMGVFEYLDPDAVQAVLNRVYGLLLNTQPGDRKSTRLNSSHVAISYAVFCLKKKNKQKKEK